MRESTILKLVRLACSEIQGMVTFRNNVGTAVMPDGTPVRFGLCRGSSDLIGWRTITVGPEHVGRRIAVFTAIETKSARGRLRPEQTNFLAAVARAGGLAIVARSPEDIYEGVGSDRAGLHT